MFMFARTFQLRFGRFTVLVLSIVLLGGSIAPGALLNPGFESPDASGGDQYASTNWFGFNDAYTTVNVTPNSGLQALKIFGPFFQYGGAGVVQPGFAASPGETWEASAYALNSSADPIQGSNFAVVKMEFLDAGNSVIGAFESPQVNASTPQNTWTLRSVQGMAPAGTVAAQIVLVHVQMNAPVTGGVVFFDDASFAVVPEPTSVAAAVIGFAGLVLRRRRR